MTKPVLDRPTDSRIGEGGEVDTTTRIKAPRSSEEAQRALLNQIIELHRDSGSGQALVYPSGQSNDEAVVIHDIHAQAIFLERVYSNSALGARPIRERSNERRGCKTGNHRIQSRGSDRPVLFSTPEAEIGASMDTTRTPTVFQQKEAPKNEGLNAI